MLYFLTRMKDFLPTMRSRFVSSMVVSLTLMALCFSVGEGLRLTPFPVSQNAQVDFSSINRGSQSSIYTYGPLDIPIQTQKRSKRFAIDLLCPAPLGTGEFVPQQYPAFERRTHPFISTLLIAFPSERGPPHIS